MKINSKLNLVVPVDSNEGKIHFHSMPINREVFQRYHFVICAAFTKLLSADMTITGPKIAAMTVEEIARDMGKWDGDTGVQKGFIGEITRLTNVLCLGEKGWESYPVNIALQRDFIQEDDWEEAKQRIVFFTLVCNMTRMNVRNELLQIMDESWQTQTTSLGCMDFIDSLLISNEKKTTAKTKKTSSVIS